VFTAYGLRALWVGHHGKASPTMEDGMTVSQGNVEEGFRLQRHQNELACGAQSSQSNRDEPADRDLGR
jgi:hypothetical protein